MGTRRDVFVIMPFSATNSCSEADWTDIYENVFRVAVESCGYSCERVECGTGSLITSIIEKLRNAYIVLADITDGNPNVFYELGVRHSLSKRTIIVAQHESSIPSDLRGYWSVIYGTKPGQVKKFRDEIRRILSDIKCKPDKTDSPVSDYLERENLVASRHVQTENIKKLTALYTECTGNLLALDVLSAGKVSSMLAQSISFDCLRLLLQTLYVDPGPPLLKRAYELARKLRAIELQTLAPSLLEAVREDIEVLANEILAIRNKLSSGEYSEPSTISTMMWTPLPMPVSEPLEAIHWASLARSTSLTGTRRRRPSRDIAFGLCAEGAQFVNANMGDSIRLSSHLSHTSRRVGRNDKCPCGSGRKYKNCCAKS